MLAFTLQEGTARLTTVSGRSLGQCCKIIIQTKMGCQGFFCWTVSVLVWAANVLFQCNCFAGGMDAALVFLGASWDQALPRLAVCLVYAFLVLVLLALAQLGSEKWVSRILTFVMGSMIVLFLTVVIQMAIQGKLDDIKTGTWQDGHIIISLVGTTAIGPNLFLGGDIAKNKTLPAWLGIGISTFLAFIVSILILVAGSGVKNETADTFKITDLIEVIAEQLPYWGEYIFGVGFMAAAYSSMITVCQSATVTADSFFSEVPRREEDRQEAQGVQQMGVEGREVEKMSIWYHWGINFSLVGSAVLVITLVEDREEVIRIAQVVNGISLPFYCHILLFCLNDDQLMSPSPQSFKANFFLTLCVLFTDILSIIAIFKESDLWLRVGLSSGFCLVDLAALLCAKYNKKMLRILHRVLAAAANRTSAGLLGSGL